MLNKLWGRGESYGQAGVAARTHAGQLLGSTVGGGVKPFPPRSWAGQSLYSSSHTSARSGSTGASITCPKRGERDVACVGRKQRCNYSWERWFYMILDALSLPFTRGKKSWIQGLPWEIGQSLWKYTQTRFPCVPQGWGGFGGKEQAL